MPIIIKRKPKVAPPQPVVVTPPAPKAKPTARKSGRVLDGMCKVAIKMAPMSIVPWWLMASYLYYVHDLSLLSDALYDQLAKDMLASWGDIKHPHKHMITPDHLKAGSLFSLKEEDYPLMTRYAAAQLAKGEWGIIVEVKF